ncbi:MAG: hypothetical protein LH629_02050, partial [Ignavibacteria bacterium]|nr:hypothetical protein [Ignavibacteria bacterium]
QKVYSYVCLFDEHANIIENFLYRDIKIYSLILPQTNEFYKTGNKDFVFSLIRIAVQFLLIAWAWIYTKGKFKTD